MTKRKSEEKNEAFMETLRELRSGSRYMQIDEYARRNQVIRADIRVSKFVICRVIIDLASRVPDSIVVGYELNGRFKALNYKDYELATENFKEAAKKLEKLLYGFYQAYHHRFERAHQITESKKEKMSSPKKPTAKVSEEKIKSVAKVIQKAKNAYYNTDQFLVLNEKTILGLPSARIRLAVRAAGGVVKDSIYDLLEDWLKEKDPENEVLAIGAPVKKGEGQIANAYAKLGQAQARHC